MNSSMLTSDRATHAKIGLTAALATAVVIMIGVYAKPSASVGGQPARATAQSTMIASLDQRPTIAR